MNEYFNLNFERSILSSFLFSPESLDENIDLITEIDFYLPSHANVFKAMVLLSQSHKPIDEEFIKQELIKLKLFDEQVMMEIMISNPISNTAEYIFEIIELSNQRKLARLSVQLKEELSTEDKVDLLKSSIDNIENSVVIADEIDCSELLNMEFENKVTYETGIDTIAKGIGGLEKGQLIYITGMEESGKCVDGDTEFLSPNGWIKIKDWKGEKVCQYKRDESAEFVQPTYHYSDMTDKFYHLKTTQMDMMVTSSHRIPYITSKGNLNIKKFSELYESKVIAKAKMINTINLKKSSGINYTDSEIRLHIAILADGSIRSLTKQVRIRIKKQRKKDRLVNILTDCGICFKEKHYGKDKSFSDFVFYWKDATKDISFLWKSSSNQLQLISDEFAHWDGSFTKNSRKFYTAKKEEADFIQYAIVSCGERAMVSKTDRRGMKQGRYIRKSVEYQVTASKWKHSTVVTRKKEELSENIKEVIYKEKVPCYCFTVPDADGMWVARRNGYIFVTGNTHLSYKIMENLSVGFKTGIISLEFGKRKLKDRLSGMISRGHKLEPRNIKASFESHSIAKIEKIIKKWVSEGVGFIVLDSFNLIENFKSKDATANIIDTGRRLFKLTQQLDILLLVISTSTKSDHKEGNPSIYGGQLLNHYCDQKWHILRDMETEERLLWVNKNKQNFRYSKEKLHFMKDGSISMFKVEETSYQNTQIQIPSI